MLRALAIGLALFAAASHAADRLVKLETRPGVKVAYWMMERPGATATVVLLPGGDGSIGLRDGAPRSQNFLVRSRDDFAAAGLNVAIVGKPSDHGDLDAAFRGGAEHVADLKAIAAKLRGEYGKPLWLVGTSLGTISAAAAASAMGPEELAGIVLTSSVTGTNRYTALSVPQLKLSDIRVPVLVMHHRKDACDVCDPYQAHRIVEALDHAPVKKLLLVDGGGPPTGKPCQALHYHGYIGMEAEAVKTITGWIARPSP